MLKIFALPAEFFFFFFSWGVGGSRVPITFLDFLLVDLTEYIDKKLDSASIGRPAFFHFPWRHERRLL